MIGLEIFLLLYYIQTHGTIWYGTADKRVSLAEPVLLYYAILDLVTVSDRKYKNEHVYAI